MPPLAGFNLTPEFNPDWKNRDPGCKFPSKVQLGSTFGASIFYPRIRSRSEKFTNRTLPSGLKFWVRQRRIDTRRQCDRHRGPRGAGLYDDCHLVYGATSATNFIRRGIEYPGPALTSFPLSRPGHRPAAAASGTYTCTSRRTASSLTPVIYVDVRTPSSGPVHAPIGVQRPPPRRCCPVPRCRVFVCSSVGRSSTSLFDDTNTATSETEFLSADGRVPRPRTASSSPYCAAGNHAAGRAPVARPPAFFRPLSRSS